MDGIELMATAMHAAKSRLDVSAGNLANVSSEGFHRRLARATLSARGLVVTSEVDRRQGPLRHTGRSFDLAVAGEGAFLVRDPSGATSTLRSGSLSRDPSGRLADERGRVLLGRDGTPIVAGSDATIDARGIVHEAGRQVAQIALRPGAVLASGFLEASNVDAVGEMVDVLGAERAFETAQKTLSALDEERQKDVNDVVRVKS